MNIKYEKVDRLKSFRADVEKQEREFARQRREERRAELVREDREARKAAEGEVAQLRAEFEYWKEMQTDAVGAAVAQFVDDAIEKLLARFEEHVLRTRCSIMDSTAARFASLERQIAVLEGRAKGEFEFARERADVSKVVDLPNPLRFKQRLDS
jgi:hypothetical protein